MAQDEKRSLAKDELYQAIHYFVERQQLVVQAMTDMKLDINAIGKFGALGWVSGAASENGQKPVDRFEYEPVNEIEKEIYAILRYSEEIRVPRKGVWNDQTGQVWNYTLHGGGCLLVNSETQEPIDWDCPNQKAFDEFFFNTHLAWRLKQGDEELKNMQELYSEVKSLFSELVNDGLIQPCQMPMGLVYLLKENDAR
ncbi:MAG: hypothetical protein KA314_14375 [Chloroflexi bacterium]|nr:hypothetical protein [Chloroflexota bacterium]MBP8057019.1 hypothetical protein [Chloroflexota bacterium]